MEHSLTAPIDGIARLHVKVGDQVTGEQLLAAIEPHETPEASAETSANEQEN